MAKATESPETPHIFVRGEGGAIFKMDLPLHETIEERLAKGYLVRVANADCDPYVPEPESPEVPSTPTERPALDAGKPAWVGWAVHNGMTPDDAEALTVQDLIEKFGQPAAPPVPPAPPIPPKPADPAGADKK